MQDQLNYVIGEIRSALRFRWIALGLAFLLFVAGSSYVATLPDIYEAQARFFLNTSSLLERALQNEIIATDPESRLAYIRENLFSTVELEAVAIRVGLDANIDDELAFERMLTNFRQDIVFRSLSPASSPRGSADRIYQLSYRHVDRQKAIDVVQALLDLFIEGTLDESRRDEDDALESLEDQISVAEAHLSDVEKDFGDFKRENADQLPGAQGDFQRRIQAVEKSLTDARRNLRSLESRLVQHQREIENLSAVIPSASFVELPPGSLQARRRDLQLQLDELRLRYQDNYPDILELEVSIEDLDNQIQTEREAAGAEGLDPGLVAFEANPVFQQAQIARAETEFQIAERQAQIEDLEAERTELESLRDESLANEATQAELERDVADARSQLNTLVETRRALERTRAVQTSNPVRFRPLDPPNALMTPVAPERLKLLLEVFVLALGAGGALAFGLAQIRPIFPNAGALKQFAELPVLGTVADAWPAREQVAFRRSAIAYSAALLLLFTVFVGLAGIEAVGPGIHVLFEGGSASVDR